MDYTERADLSARAATRLPSLRDFYTNPRVIVMTLEEQGACLRLLHFSILTDGGGIPRDPRDLAQIIKVTPAVLQALWRRLAPCFEDHPGLPGQLVWRTDA